MAKAAVVDEREWNFHRHDGRIALDSEWRDDRGNVVLWLSYGTSTVIGVVYKRNGVKYQLGQRRFDRDFTMKPFIEASVEHPAIYRKGKRLVAGKNAGKRRAGGPSGRSET